jgi:hypothetical protein
MLSKIFRPAALVCALAGIATAGSPRPIAFREHVVASNLKMGYQLVAADLNSDGKPDLIAVDERATELAWYENPTWQRHVIAKDVPRAINLDCADLDGDGTPEIVFLYRFESVASKSVGTVALLHHDGDPRRPWTLREIDRVPAAHRVRFFSYDGSGNKVAVMAPMAGLQATPPLYAGPTPVYIYRPPEWSREQIASLEGIVHGLYPIDWLNNGRQYILTASFRGLRLLSPPAASGPWTEREISPGDTNACPKCGSSEVALGHLKNRRFLAVIEPWHGTSVVIYIEQSSRAKPSSQWTRTVIDGSYLNGHALAVGDLDGDRRDEVVAGFRGQGHQLSLYQAADSRGKSWKRTPLDTAIAPADCKIRDFNGDGRPDIACIGASTGNIKWYENLPR